MRRFGVAESLFIAAWTAVVALCTLLIFLAVIGAWKPAENPALAIVLAAVVLVLTLFGLWQRRRRMVEPDHLADRRVVRERERRGF
jgi:membrane protein implicated in regulation of membrane protease activity